MGSRARALRVNRNAPIPSASFGVRAAARDGDHVPAGGPQPALPGSPKLGAMLTTSSIAVPQRGQAGV
jgi:hypothetical protein